MKPGDAAGKPWSRTDAAQSCVSVLVRRYWDFRDGNSPRAQEMCFCRASFVILLHARWRGQRYDSKNQKTVQAAIQWFTSQGHYTELKIEGEHQLDAALSAWATGKGLTENWPSIIGEGANLVFPLKETRYLWPDALR
jgi:hypothetical protein